MDPGELAAVTPAGSDLGDAVEAVMLAVKARVLRFGPGDIGPWERVVWLTGGLLSGRPPLPPVLSDQLCLGLGDRPGLK